MVQEVIQTGLSSTGIEVSGNDFQDDQKVKAYVVNIVILSKILKEWNMLILTRRVSEFYVDKSYSCKCFIEKLGRL